MFNASAIGAKQFVVQEAAEMIVSEALNVDVYKRQVTDSDCPDLLLTSLLQTVCQRKAVPVPACNPLTARIWSCPV